MKNKNNQCPNEEIIACYIDGLLSSKEKGELDRHLLTCPGCKEIFSIQTAVARVQKEEGLGFVPDRVTTEAKKLVDEKYGVKLLNLVASFTEKAFEVVRTTGEVISGHHLQPAFALRDNSGTNIAKTFTIRKVFDNTRVEMEITRETGDSNTIILRVRDNQVEIPTNDLRATLIQDETELESYITQNGKAIFESVKSGRYLIELSQVSHVLGAITLELTKE